MAARNVVHVVVPDAIDDPLRPSGGNRYDGKACDGLVAAGWQVHQHTIPDAWPRLGRTGSGAVADVVARIPDDALVLVDGLIALGSAPVFVPAARRLALVVLVHAVPDGQAADSAVLRAARAVIATSGWVRDSLFRSYPLPRDAIAVAEPGVDRGRLAAGTPSGRQVICIASVAPHKGHDVLLAALASLTEHAWACRCVGSLEHDAAFVTTLCRDVHAAGLADRFQFTGPRTPAELATVFDSADVLVHPARVEGYGMAVTEALAHGLPVITTTAGGLIDTLGVAPDGVRPGLLVPPGDTVALANAIAGWLSDDELRSRLRHAARERRDQLPSWTTTVERIDQVLRGAA